MSVVGWIEIGWLGGLTLALVLVLLRLYRAYLRLIVENGIHRATIVQMENAHRINLAGLAQLFEERLQALAREIVDIRQRWTVSATTQEWQERYIETLELSHHIHLIALPRKPHMERMRPIVAPTIDDDVRDLDFIDELLSPVRVRE